MSSAIDEILAKLNALPDDKREEIEQMGLDHVKDKVWIPNPGPQADAYYSEADVLLYGGEPGGGKSSLVLGLAMTAHQNSIIMRRQYTDLGHLVDEAIKFNKTRKGFNGSPPPRLNTQDDRKLEFFAAAKVGDEQHRQGQPFDFMGVDEATQFAKSQILFLKTWLRSTVEGQRQRIVFATNPPLTADGLWVTEMFAPWIDDKFPDPAEPGELRWAVLDKNDDMVWVDGPQEVWMEHEGEYVEAESYTYIPASVEDNPFLMQTNYKKRLANMPTELHEVMMGGFKSTFRDAENQIIPTDWVRLSQERWSPEPPESIPMCAMGVDCTGGGKDPLVIAPRYDGWYAPFIKIDAEDIPKHAIGKTTAGQIVAHRKDGALPVIDMGGGYGNATYEKLHDNEIEAKGYLGAEKTTRRTKDGKIGFVNTRTAAYWAFREALDPDQPGGSPIALPKDNRLLAGLTAVTFEFTPNGIKAEPKVKYDEHGKVTGGVKAKLGFSPDEADAVVMAWFYGPKEANSALEWAERRERKRKRGQQPKAVMGRKHARRR